jgi:hypothetical protein
MHDGLPGDITSRLGCALCNEYITGLITLRSRVI